MLSARINTVQRLCRRIARHDMTQTRAWRASTRTAAADRSSQPSAGTGRPSKRSASSSQAPASKRRAKPAKIPEQTAPVTTTDADGITRCGWATMYAGAGRAEYVRYHDEEWGRPKRDDVALFEKLVLEGAQAGLSWSTIFAKRDAYRRCYKGFDPQAVAKLGPADIERLMAEGSGIVRHRAKVESVVHNAKCVLEVQESEGSLAAFLWGFVPDGKPIVNKHTSLQQVPKTTPQAEAMSKALKQRGFKFVGPISCYSLMQAMGMVNDHLVSCHCYQRIIDSY